MKWSLAPLLLVCVLTAGCEQLGIDTPAAAAAKRDADSKAIGGACRHAGPGQALARDGMPARSPQLPWRATGGASARQCAAFLALAPLAGGAWSASSASSSSGAEALGAGAGADAGSGGLGSGTTGVTGSILFSRM